MKFILRLNDQVYTVVGNFEVNPEPRYIMLFANADHAYNFSKVAKLPDAVQIDVYNG